MKIFFFVTFIFFAIAALTSVNAQLNEGDACVPRSEPKCGPGLRCCGFLKKCVKDE